MAPDVLYIVREGPNEELRYSLRSLQNIAHSRVIIAGYAPDWVDLSKVEYVPVEQEPLKRHDAWDVKYRNARRNLAQGLQIAGEDVILMNDDIFIMQRFERIPVLHMGNEDEFRAVFRSSRTVTSRYVQGELDTLEWVRANYGVEQPNSYSLHTPFPLKTKFALKLLAHMPHLDPPLHFRTAYGNIYQIGGKKTRDFKISGPNKAGRLVRLNGKVISNSAPINDRNSPFLSTTERSFGSFEVGKRIRSAFPQPGPYELRGH